MKYPVRVLALAASALVASCGGGGGGGGGAVPAGTQSLSVSVIDGPIANAVVCLDRNNNDVCDADEPSARTGNGGTATLNVDPSDNGKYPVLAMVGTDATDADHGAVTVPYVMKAPADRPGVVTPLTTLVQTRVELTGEDTATAEAAVQDGLGTTASLTTNYSQDTSANGAQLGALARLVALATQSEVQSLGASVGTQAVDAGTIGTGDQQHAIRRRMLELLPTFAEQVGTGSVQAAVASSSAAQIDAALQPLVTRVTTAASFNQQALAIQVAIDRTPAGAGTPVANAHVTYLNYTDAQDYTAFLVAQTLAQATPDANGTAHSSVRATGASSGQVANWAMETSDPVRQSDLHWSGSTWTQCDGSNTQSAPDAQGRAAANSCESREVAVSTHVVADLSGQKMTEVVSMLSSIGVSTFVVGQPSALGAALFPTGSQIAYDNGAATAHAIGYYPGTANTVRSTSAAVAGGDATACATAPYAYTEPSTLDAIVAADRGTPCVFAPGSLNDSAGTFSSGPRNEWWDQSTVSIATVGSDVTSANAASYYTSNELLQAGFGAGNAVTYYSCQQRATDGSARNCNAIGTGTYAIATLGDARVLTFQGEPVRAGVSHRVLVERGGKVYYGYRDHLGAGHGAQLNTTATSALFTQLGIPLPDPNVAPPRTLASYQGSWDIAAPGTDWLTGDSDTLVLTPAFDGTGGYYCQKHQGVTTLITDSCAITLDAASGAATLTIVGSGTATVTMTVDPVAGSGSGTFTPGSGIPHAVTVQRR